MGQIGNMVADAATVGVRHAKRILVSIPADRFARFACPGGQPVHSNHPAFNVGHLTLYPLKVLELLGVDKTPASPPASYVELFSKDAQCVDDADGQIYPSKDELLEVFFRTYDAAILALRACEDDQLLATNPVDTPLKGICPTLGSMLTFYMTGHVMGHIGQLSTWRRMEGLPPA